MCASCLCTRDGCVEQNAFAQAQALSVPSCHIDLSFRHQWRETFSFSLLFKICQAVLKHGEQAKETETAAKVSFLVFLTENTMLEQRKLAFLGHVLVGGRC